MNRVGQVWAIRYAHGDQRSLFVVIKPGRRRGVDHHNPYNLLWTHDCLHLETGEQHEMREWSDEAWEGRVLMERIA